jgi:amino acid transporter
MQEIAEDAAVTTATPLVVPFWKVMVLSICSLQIGPGIALSAGYLLHYSGRASWLPLTAATGICLLVAVAISRFATRSSVTASILSFAQLTLPRWAVAATAAALLLGYIIAPASGVLSVTIYLASLVNSLGYAWSDTSLMQSIVASAAAILIGACAYRGVDLSAKVSLVLGLACIPIALWISWSAGRSFGFDVRAEFSLDGQSWISIARSTFVAMGLFVGFDGVAALASETAAPKRNVPRVLYWTMCIAGITIVDGAMMQAPVLLAHAAAVDAGESPTKLLAVAGRIPAAATVTAAADILLAMAIIAGLIAFANCAAIIVATAANDGFLPRTLGRIHPRHGSPHHAVIFLTLVSVLLSVMLLVWTKAAPILSTVYLTNVTVLLWLIPYALICAAAIKRLGVGERTEPAQILSALGLVAILLIAAAQVIWPLDRVSGIVNAAGFALIITGSVVYFLLTPRAPQSGPNAKYL